MELISIIIPAHNYGHYISETLDSVISQTYQHWECMIIDDGSTDDTREIVAAYIARDARFRYTYQQSQGVSRARNIGLAQAKGEYIQFLDADDLLLPKKLELHIDYLAKQTEVDIVYSETRYFANNNRQTLSASLDMQNQEWMPKVMEQDSALEFLVKGNIMPIQSPLTRMSLIERVGEFNPEIRYCEDWEYWFRCAAADGVIRFLDNPQAGSLIRVHQSSATQNVSQMNAGAQLIADKVYDFVCNNPEKVKDIILTDIKRSRALELIAKRQRGKGLWLYAQTLTRPSSGKISIKDILYWLLKSG